MDLVPELKLILTRSSSWLVKTLFAECASVARHARIIRINELWNGIYAVVQIEEFYLCGLFE
jgi:hypothetical protein